MSKTEEPTMNLRTQVKMDKIVKQEKMYPSELRDHSGPVNRVILNRQNTLFASCSNDSIINVYNAITFELINQFKTKKEAVKHIAFTDKGDKLIASTLLDPWYIFDIFEYQENQEPFKFVNQALKISDFSLSYGDKYLAFVYQSFNTSDKDAKSINKIVVYDFEELLKRQKADDSGMTDFKKCLVESYVLDAPKGVKFMNIEFFYKEDTFYVSDFKNNVYKYQLKKDGKIDQVNMKAMPDVGFINSLTFSPKYELLMVNCQNGLVMLDPESLTEFRNFRTKHPVLCAQISPLLYSINPKYHVIFAGGIAARDQALAAEGGNEIFVYNFAIGSKITELSGCFGNINWLSVFKDGSGFLTAGEEAIVRIYRFDKSYYEKQVDTKED